MVDEFDRNQVFAREAVGRLIYVMELDSAVYRSEERAIESSAMLQD